MADDLAEIARIAAALGAIYEDLTAAHLLIGIELGADDPALHRANLAMQNFHDLLSHMQENHAEARKVTLT